MRHMAETRRKQKEAGGQLPLGFLLGLLLLTLHVWALPPALAAARLIVTWEYPRTAVPQVVSFHIGYASSAAPEQVIETMTVPPSAVGACAVVPSATDDTLCAVWPACPTAGTVILFWVEAVGEQMVSARSNLALCQFTADRPCECLDPSEEPPAPPPAALPPEATPAHWTDALAAILSALPAAAP
jgi:hypothetical protein